MLAEGAWISQQADLGRSSDIHGFLDSNLVTPFVLSPASPIILGLMTQGPLSRHLGEAVSLGHQMSPSALRIQGTLYWGSNAIQQPSQSAKTTAQESRPLHPTPKAKFRMKRRSWKAGWDVRIHVGAASSGYNGCSP